MRFFESENESYVLLADVGKYDIVVLSLRALLGEVICKGLVSDADILCSKIKRMA